MMLLISAGSILLTAGCVEKPEPEVEMVLGNYPKLFEKDVIIVVGENATQIEMEGAQAIAENLGNVTGNMPVIKKDVEITGNEKAGYNLILVSRPDANEVIREVYNRTNATRVSWEYPGGYKGILEILRNPWNESKTMLLVEGSDDWGVRVGNLILKENKNLEHQSKVFVDWEEYSRVKFPIDSPEEAIKYAETDHDVEKFMKKWPNIKSWTNLGQNNTVWTVSFYPADVQDVWFEISFKPDGMIIRKGIGSI